MGDTPGSRVERELTAADMHRLRGLFCPMLIFPELVEQGVIAADMIDDARTGLHEAMAVLGIEMAQADSKE